MALRKAGSDARKRVLDTAERLFHQRSYGAVSMRDIAAELNIRKASLYHYAPEGKERLFVEVVSRSFHRHQHGLEEAVQQSGGDVRERLRAMMHWFIQHAPLGLLSMLQSDMPTLSPENASLLESELRRCIFLPIRGVFDLAIRRGELRESNPDHATGCFLSLIDGLTHIGTSGHVPLTMEAMAEQILDIVLYGLVPRTDIPMEKVGGVPLS